MRARLFDSKYHQFFSTKLKKFIRVSKGNIWVQSYSGLSINKPTTPNYSVQHGQFAAIGGGPIYIYIHQSKQPFVIHHIVQLSDSAVMGKFKQL